MRPHLVPWLALVASACGSTSHAVRPDGPIATPCTTERIGAVQVIGAPRALVPGLAVLEGTLDDPDRTARIVQAATEALAWRGYARARIDVGRATACFTDLHVTVALGPKYTIGRITFAGDDELPRRERLAALEDALGTVNTVGGVLIEYRLRRALDGLAKRYRDAGWLDVAIGAPVAQYTDDGVVDITIPVTAGERYRVAVVRALGANASVRAKLLDELAISPGTWYDGPSIRRALERARRSIDRRVHLRASAFEDRHEIELEAIVGATR